MRENVRGSDNRSAAELCALGISQMGRWKADAVQYIDSAIEADSHYRLPVIIKANILQGANDACFDAEVADLISRCKGLPSANPKLENGLLDAVSYAHQGMGVEAATVYEQMLHESPKSLLLHSLAQEQIFWLGQPQWMLDVVERAAPSWHETDQDYGPLLSMRAFANEEAGFFEQAEKFGREAVEIDPSDVWGAHAVAHVLDMKGQTQAGIDWLDGLSGNWSQANQMRHHLWWHICLFLLEMGQYDQIIELLDTQIRNLESPLVKDSPAATIDITNYASLLLRLELYGVNVSEHWPKLAKLCGNRITNHGSAFSNVHDMMVLSGNGDREQASTLLASMTQRFESSDQMGSLAMSFKVVGIPVCEAILAYGVKDYSQVLHKLGGVRHQLQMMGASHAQRDVFFHMLVVAAEHEQREDLRAVFIRDIERLGYFEVPNRAAYKTKVR